MRENICFQQIRIVNLSACHALESIRHDFIDAPILGLWSLIQTVLARKSALEKIQLSDVLITNNLF